VGQGWQVQQIPGCYTCYDAGEVMPELQVIIRLSVLTMLSAALLTLDLGGELETGSVLQNQCSTTTLCCEAHEQCDCGTGVLRCHCVPLCLRYVREPS
jgi:hypothetical protein